MAGEPAPTVTTLAVADRRTVALFGFGGTYTRDTTERIAAEIGDAVEAVVAFWGSRWQRDIRVDVTATAEQFAASMSGSGAQGSSADVAAVAVATWVDPDSDVAEGQRIVLGPGAHQMGDAALRLVLRHELFHFAARAQTALDAPVWISEGVADYVARPEPQVAPATVTSLPTDAEFAGPEPGRSRAYDAAWSFSRFVADTWGDSALRQLYVRTAGVGHPDMPSAVREVLGLDMTELVAQWVRWQRVP